MWIPGPSKPSTSSERAVIVWLVVFLSVGLGLYLTYLGCRAPSTQAALAAKAVRIGLGLVGLGAVVAAIRVYTVRWFS